MYKYVYCVSERESECYDKYHLVCSFILMYLYNYNYNIIIIIIKIIITMMPGVRSWGGCASHWLWRPLGIGERRPKLCSHA